jgi:hypothetical protein
MPIFTSKGVRREDSATGFSVFPVATRDAGHRYQILAETREVE